MARVQRSAQRGRPQTEIGKGAVSTRGIIAISGLLVAGAAVLLYSLWAFWPPAATAQNSAPSCVCRWFSVRFNFDRERNILVVVAIAGGLGSSVHALRSIARYVGERYLFRSWLLLYVTLPLVGAILGTIVYLVLRAGLITGGGASQDPVGFAAVAALVGLFSTQAAEKLKQVFETLLTTAEQGADALPSAPPLIAAVSPIAAAVGEMITITGSNFVDGGTEVIFGGGIHGDSVTVTTTGVSLTVVVPEGATTARLTITTPGGSATSTGAFTVQ